MSDIDGVPMIDPEDGEPMMEAINNALYALTDNGLDRSRPYDGQPWTDQGERGKTLVAGLTFRDICDCFVIGFLSATGRSSLAESGTASYNDVYEAARVDPSFDPLAVMQNMACEMERRMGIYPNVPTIYLSDPPAAPPGGQDG